MVGPRPLSLCQCSTEPANHLRHIYQVYITSGGEYGPYFDTKRSLVTTGLSFTFGLTSEPHGAEHEPTDQWRRTRPEQRAQRALRARGTLTCFNWRVKFMLHLISLLFSVSVLWLFVFWETSDFDSSTRPMLSFWLDCSLFDGCPEGSWPHTVFLTGENQLRWLLSAGFDMRRKGLKPVPPSCPQRFLVTFPPLKSASWAIPHVIPTCVSVLLCGL